VKNSKMLWRGAWGVVIAVVVFAAWWYLPALQVESAESSKPNNSSASQAPRHAQASLPEPPTRAIKPGPAERALDVSALRATLAEQADADAQVRRIVALARFRDQIAAYASSGEAMPAAERAQTARQLLSELPEHVARNEILPVQAEAMTAALLIDAEADPAAREAKIAAARAQWDAYARQTVGPSPAQDPRAIAYAQQSKEIVAQVQSSTPDPQQQQTLIAQRLQALRVQLFDHASSPDTH
jgi:phospholipase C accessory protein PlcR